MTHDNDIKAQVDQQSNNGRGQNGSSGQSQGGSKVYDASNPSFGSTPDAEASSLPQRPDQMNHHIVDIPSSSTQDQSSEQTNSPGRSSPDGEQGADGQGDQETTEESWLQRSSRLLLGQSSSSGAGDQPVLGQLKTSKQGARHLVLPVPIIKPPLVSPG